MPARHSSEAACVMAMDIHGFSKLHEADHDKIIKYIYRELARILSSEPDPLLDKKTIGDGFIFYFKTPSAAVEVAFKTRTLFSNRYVWERENISVQPSCRIALHAGQFFWFRDAIENRKALFGRNIISVGRLEPVVRNNEIWCTQAFREAARTADFRRGFEFIDLGKCELAKGWGEQNVFALHEKGRKNPPLPIPRNKPRLIQYDNKRLKDFQHTYFALIRLKNRSDGVVHLRRHLVEPTFHFEAVYYLFGNFDVLARFKTHDAIGEDKFSELLWSEKISHKRDKCKLLEIYLETEPTKEPIVVFPKENHRFLKAFTYIKSDVVVGDKHLINKILAFAKKACGKQCVVTYYHNRNHLILPIVVPVEQYYALAEAIEAIESFLDEKQLDDARVTTYPVHGFEETFELHP